MTTKANNTKRGFALLDAETRKKIASKGAQVLHANGKAHRFTREEASQAGRKGGIATSRDRAHMASIGRKGGSVTANRRETDNQSTEN